MAKVEKESEAPKLEAVEEALTRTEQFIEKNQKVIIIAIAAVILVVGGYLAYKKFIVEENEKTAHAQMFTAERYFEADSFKLALNGDGNADGFLTIIEDYGGTKSANLAKYYAGLCYYKSGDYEAALNYLEDFSAKDKMLSSISQGVIGDVYSDKDDYEKALKYYLKAADKNPNDFTSPLYLMKAARVYEFQKKYDKALELYERIQKEYPRSNEGANIQKYIAKVKTITGK